MVVSADAVSVRASCSSDWSCPPPHALSSAQASRALTMLVRIMLNHSLKKISIKTRSEIDS